jgi:ankyrin repeat protein
MNRSSFLSRLFRLPILRFAIVILFAFTWSRIAFCGEIHDAAMRGDLKKVRKLLKKNPTLIASKNKNGWMPLHYVAMYGHKDVAESLLVYGADVNAKTNGGQTPLHNTMPLDRIGIAELLLANGAMVNIKDKYGGNTPLHTAAAWGHKDAVELLLAHGAAINAQDDKGETPLHRAAVYRNIVQRMAVNAKDDDNDPASLKWAADHKAVVELLLAKGADANAKTNDGKTPLNFAAEHGKKDVIELLRQHGGHE